MKLKKLLALALALVMVLALAACGGDSANTPTQAPATQTPATQAPATQTPATEAPAPTEEPLAPVMLAMGNSDVPVGQYTQKILAYYGLDEDVLANKGYLTYGSNVKEVTTQVSEATVDCGIIYATDAFSANLTVVDTATAEMCGQVIYPAAVLNITQHEAAARAFLAYLTGDEATAVFEGVGFSKMSETQEFTATGETVELIVFAAASMKETLTAIAERYKEVEPNVTLVFTFDSSGTLKTQIQEGADCDIFISAAPKQMNQLDISASAEVNTEGLDFVLEGTRINLLENKVALAVPDGNPANITSYDDLAARLGI